MWASPAAQVQRPALGVDSPAELDQAAAEAKKKITHHRIVWVAALSASRSNSQPVKNREGEVRHLAAADAVELGEHKRVGEEDRVAQERLGGQRHEADHRAPPVVAEEHPGEIAVGDGHPAVDLD